MTRDELKARLLAEAEQAIEGLLAEKSAAGTSSLDEIERLALKGGAQFEASVLKAFGHEELEADDRVEQICERCGSRMQRRGTHRRQVVTEAGATRLERAYYVCSGCGADLFPPG
jgi:DNA-directed RNA polymerase subunit RPC12/RpoP